MNVQESFVTALDGSEIYLRKWLPERDPRGIIQIAHGMTEHADVYTDFIAALLEAGYGVYAHDHKGHGKTVKREEDYGHFKPNVGWNEAVSDVIFVSETIRKEQTCPLFLLGHSMGSFLSRRAVQLKGELYDGFLISGTGGNPGILGSIGHKVATIEMKLRGEKTKSPMLNFLSFGNFNSHFKPNRTKFDWLSSDNNQVDKYIADPLCGFICTTSFYRELFSGVLEVNKLEEFKKTPKNLPIHIFSGDRDPVGDMGKGVKEVYENYKKCDVKDVTLRLYENGRHEMFHEVNRDEVFQDLISWLDGHIV
ncbi:MULTISPECIES: alpha/beta hydrolase [Bacillus cereus group]|uniref:alpha/beta hydrolase n=1 Tax=Bacillus cereus group TaxID=86661 RepID=UPI0008FDADB2|nr:MULTISPECIES: alpha/beta hydrolase [Bacillus cereus group]MDG1621859.1 alpha/beta hydrolase [Bacillus mobilis]MDX5837642.1 alpha/beta hydrolase [Bacillus cereus group sp. BfR-BA-01700]MED4386536.1 alpha/beta hydrolase [Bacillus mobilis]OJE42580.1 alpha/beta hydrolase [Bacillus mobilis]HDR7242964.1 alpha/beta hydrolase [Bacillus mobilis]